MSQNANDIRAGATVFHKPTGETWVVGAVRGEELIPAGWPPVSAKIADCELIEPATDDEHIHFLWEMTRSDGNQGFGLIRYEWAISNLIEAAEKSPKEQLQYFAGLYRRAAEMQRQAEELQATASNSRYDAIRYIRAVLAPDTYSAVMDSLPKTDSPG